MNRSDAAADSCGTERETNRVVTVYVRDYGHTVAPERIEQTVAAYFAALRAMDVDAFAATFAPEGVTHDPLGMPPSVGHTAIRQFIAGSLGCSRCSV